MALRLRTAEVMVRDTVRTLVNALGLSPDDQPHYRCCWVDDDPTADAEDTRYPLIEITSGYWGPGLGQTVIYLSALVELRIATDPARDPKKATLVRIVDALLPTLQNRNTAWDWAQVSADGASAGSVSLSPSALLEVGDRDQSLTFQLTISAKAVAAE